MPEAIGLKKSFKFFAFLIPILWIFFAYYFITNRVSILTEEKYAQTAKEMKSELKTLIGEKAETVLVIAMSISKTSQIKEMLNSNLKTTLDLHNLSLELKQNTTLQNIWFQIISKDGISLYRSWTKKRGDNLSIARLDVKQMIKSPKISSTISTGKFDLSFKSMVPIYEKNEFIGFIEVLAKFNSIARKMEDKNYDAIFLVDKKYKKQLTHAHTKTFVDDYYVANINAKKTLLNFIQKKGIEHFLNITKYHLCIDNSHLNTLYQLKDIYNKEMGYFLLFHNLSVLDMTKVQQTKNNLLYIFIIIFILLSLSIYYIYSKQYKSYINDLNNKLTDEINNKTREIQSQHDEMQKIATHDSLTGLPNRLLFLDRLEHGIEQASRHRNSLYVLFLDLDRFKEVNDTYGHETGDKLLHKISFLLKSIVRKEDTISRLGGDEFTIILQEVDAKYISRITKKIIEKMQEKIIIDGKNIYTTFSIGISKYPEDGSNSEMLLRNADTAMYKAKEMGKNQYQFYNKQMTELAIQRSTLENNIRIALEKDEFTPYFQAKIDGRTGKVIGMEALARWIHPELGFISPDTFIPLAEDTGLIVPIDKYMMKKTISIIKEWHKEGMSTGKLSLNLSMKQLESSSCLENLENFLSYFALEAKYLDLEVTESQIMENPEKSIQILSKIRNLGISISIDDFGTGYSSLAYLKLLPIDQLKIDKAFIDDLPHDENDVAIVRAIIALAKSLNLSIIAEGVETKEQRDFLVKEGCPNIQGYYYSKPIPENDYKKFLLKDQ